MMFDSDLDRRVRALLRGPQDLYADLTRLCSFGPRLMGSETERLVQERLLAELESWGLSTHFQEFDVRTWTPGATRVLLHRQDEPNGRPLMAQCRQFSPPVEEQRFSLVHVGPGEARDWARVYKQAPGAAVYCNRLCKPSYQKARELGAAVYMEPSAEDFDAVQVGAMAYEDDGGPPHPARIKVSYTSGKSIDAVCGLGPADVTVAVGGASGTGRSGNIEAVVEGADPSLPEVLVGAHLDTFWITPGPVDNTTGVVAVLALARLFASPPAQPLRTFRFLLFTGEEQGKIGSGKYAAQRLPATGRPAGVYYNFDVPLGGRLVLHVMAADDGVEAEEHVRFWDELGAFLFHEPGDLYWKRLWRRTSDHYPFYRAAVPCLMIRAEPVPDREDVQKVIHTVLDTADRVSSLELHETVELSARILAQLGHSKAALPFSPFAPRPDADEQYNDT
jgi:hypothetical protein